VNRHGRKEDEVRRMLESPPPPVPGDLAARAVARGTRLLHRDRALRRALWALLAVAALAFAVWASVVEPWHTPPETTPPLEGW
jgi:ferric-dicitrate binding protein FerR (iron transport regulator)